MKNKKIKLMIVIIALIAFFLVVGIFIFNKLKNENNKYSEYIINYKKNDNKLEPTYLITISDEYDVVVNIQNEEESLVYPNYPEEYTLNFSDDNKEVLKDYIKKLFKNKETNKINLVEDDVDKQDLKLINAIINNNELFMFTDDFKIVYKDRNCEMLHDLYINGEYVCSLHCYSVENIFVKLSNNEEYPLERILTENILTIDELKEAGLRYRVIKDKVEKKLVFKISSSRVNCITPELMVYDDNTYEIRYNFSDSASWNDVEKGTYNYDVNKILQNINKYEPDNRGPYYIIDDNNTYETYDSNVELKEFLNSINVDLDRCVK